MIGNAPHSYITGVPGWETPGEQNLLLRLAQEVPLKGVIVEIGAEYGMSASLFCYGAHQTIEIVSIDLFPGDLMNDHRKNLLEAGYGPLTPNRFVRSEQVQGDSGKLGLTWPQTGYGEIDLLFIDGDHSYRGCKADIEAWTPHVKVGGRAAFHDVACDTNQNPHPLHREVLQAIVEWRKQVGEAWVLIDMVDSIMVFERRA